MASGADELMLLERVFLRLGSAETDEQLQNLLSKFLPPVLLKLSSPHETVRQKVMELLMHINRRVKSRPLIQLPIEALLTQYQDRSATTFVINFTIIYLKLGFPRLPLEKQIELVPIVLNALENKPQAHIDGLILLIVPLLGKLKLPTDPEKIHNLFGLNEKPQITKHLLETLLDILLLPYNALSPQSADSQANGSVSVPPGMSEVSFKRVTVNNPIKPEELEEMKLGAVKFLAHGVFSGNSILLHLIVACADTRFGVANLADTELKKFVGEVDWSSPSVSKPLFTLFLGTKPQKQELKQLAASTRIRLKLLNYLCRVTGPAFLFPASIQIIFDSLYGDNTNSKLKTLALNFTMNLIRFSTDDAFSKVAPILLTGMQKLIREGEEAHTNQAYVIIGMLAQKFPKIVFHDVGLLEMYFSNMESSSAEAKLQIREGLLNLMQAYKYDKFPSEIDRDGRLDILFALMQVKMKSQEPMVRFACVRMLATIFPQDHVPSKFLLLVATGDNKDDVSSEAFKSIYGTARKTDINMSNKDNKIITPPFVEFMEYVHSEAEINVKDPKKQVTTGIHILPFDIRTFNEIILYLRLCLIRNLDVPLTREVLRHPCNHTPIIGKHLQEIYTSNKNTLVQYVSLVKDLLVANPTTETFCCMNELIGCIPDLQIYLAEHIKWVRDQLNSTKEEIREYSALLYSLLLVNSSADEFDGVIKYLIAQINSKNLEAQHGALIGIGNCLENRILNQRISADDAKKWELFKESINIVEQFLKHHSPILVGAACRSIGLLGRVTALPLDNGKAETNGSPDAKRAAIEGITKIDLVNELLAIMKNTKMNAKVREHAARALGLLCVGEKFPHTSEVLRGLLYTAKETKDIEIHFTIGESLVMCCLNVWSMEARNAWKVLPDDFKPPNDELEPENNLEWLLELLLKIAAQPHPNSRQASCIWLLAVIKGCGEKKPITDRIQTIQNTFMDMLCENNDIVQDVASKGLCIIYDIYKSKDLLNALVTQLTTGTRQVSQVTSDTKIFEDGQLGKSPTGGNLTTYKELCSLASDLNKPDLIYQFMHLANHNAIWNSKKGAAFGFSTIAEHCGEDLKSHLPQIIPKLYRYQYDPTPNIQASMHNIWRVLVSEPSKILDEYYQEILADLLANINSNQYRVRQSCCLALQDLLKGSANKSIHDAISSLDELWTKLFRVMDDHHEATRHTANTTAKVLSKVCIRGCDANQGKAGIQLVEVILPPLLNIGITHTVSEIRMISLQTIGEVVNTAGKQLKPFLPKLIPALLKAAGELESAKLSYLSTALGARSEVQEVLDNARASFAKSHFTTETVSRSLQYADATILEELVPNIIDLMKSSVGLGTRVACSHFITLLTVQLKDDVQPYTGKFLAALVNGLTDRNSAIRKHYATAIGHLVSTAKESSLEKLFAKLKTWYFEREDDAVRSACAYTIQSIGIHNQEVLKSNSQVILPLVFFAMHGEKTPETQKTLEVWTEIWSEQSPGTETGIRQNIENICDMLKTGLESPSWSMKAQSANAVSTVASKLSSTMESKHRNALISCLLTGLSGRTWTGKDKLLKALASICSNCKESIKQCNEVNVSDIINAVIREAKKEEIVYKNSALECLGEVLSSLEVDQFEDVYNIMQDILTDQSTSKEDEEEISSEDMSKHRENSIKLTETAYETLGKIWPANSKETQQKYREILVNHIVQRLPKVTRSVQVSVMLALYNYIDKLSLLEEDSLSPEEDASLKKIVDDILEALKYSLDISKHTRLRKEALNIVLCLGTKLKEKNHNDEYKNLIEMLSSYMENLNNDNQPEIKSRVKDIRMNFKTL